MKKPVYLVDAFSGKAFAGNPAAVVLDAAELESKTLQAIAAELHQSETAFALPAREPQSAFHLRWFTPAAEVAFCGHGTLATLHVLVEEAKRIRVPEQGVTRLSFTCKAGRLRVELSRVLGKLHAAFEAPACNFAQAKVEPELLATLGLLPELLDPNLPPQSNPRGTGELNLFLALRDGEAVARARPDFRALGELARHQKLGGLCIFALPPEPGKPTPLRYFVPHFGVDEDPVTGSACAQLAVLIQEKLPEEMPRKLIFSQGGSLGRPGRVLVEVRPEEEPGQVRAWVSGAATVVLRGELELPR